MSTNAYRKGNGGAAIAAKSTTTVVKQKAKGGARSQRKKNNNNNFVSTAQFRGAVPPNRAPPPHRAVELVCGLTDPFCRVAKGARWPDGLGQDAMTGQVRGHKALVTYADGRMLGFYTPSISFGDMLSTSAAPFTMPAVMGSCPGGGAVTSYSATYRVVSAGIVLRNVASAFTTAGYLIVTRHPRLPAFGAAINAGSVYGTTASTHSLHAGLEIPLIFKEVGTNSRVFGNANVAAAQPDFGWDVIGVEIVGAPASTAILDVEYVINVEFTLTQTNIGLSQLTTNVSPDEPALARAANVVSTELSNMAWSSIEQFGDAALRAIRSKLGARFGALTLMV